MNESETQKALEAFEKRLPEGASILSVEWRDSPPKVVLALPLEHLGAAFAEPALPLEAVSILSALSTQPEDEEEYSSLISKKVAIKIADNFKKKKVRRKRKA